MTTMPACPVFVSSPIAARRSTCALFLWSLCWRMYMYRRITTDSTTRWSTACIGYWWHKWGEIVRTPLRRNELIVHQLHVLKNFCRQTKTEFPCSFLWECQLHSNRELLGRRTEWATRATLTFVTTDWSCERAIKKSWYFWVQGRSKYLMQRVSHHCSTDTPSSIVVYAWRLQMSFRQLWRHNSRYSYWILEQIDDLVQT